MDGWMDAKNGHKRYFCRCCCFVFFHDPKNASASSSSLSSLLSGFVLSLHHICHYIDCNFYLKKKIIALTTITTTTKK